MTGFGVPKLKPTLPTMPSGGVTVTPNANRFSNALKYVLVNEGPYSDDPRDPGGATQFGIILTEYQSFLHRDLTPEDVKNMPLSTAQAIYQRNFWGPIQGDAYSSDAVATAIFDTAVNKGLGGCKVVLADALNVTFQGEAWVYGPDLLAAVNALGPKDFINAFEPAVERYISARIAKYPNVACFERGWINRAKRLFTLVSS